MTDRRSVSSDDYKDATVKEAQVAVMGASKPVDSTTLSQISSSAEAAKRKRVAKAEASLDEAVKAEFDLEDDPNPADRTKGETSR
ncbi:hypothetical protein DTO027B9_9037 [Paecilomyces variotii]|nr:hypothetical protein DTO027B9_9037 [Paecilomyces variotii]